LIYQGVEEENLDQKSPGPPGWGLMQWVSSSHITKKQEMLKKQTPSIRYKDIIMICCNEDNQHDIVY
jgi:hypothetical protein